MCLIEASLKTDCFACFSVGEVNGSRLGEVNVNIGVINYFRVEVNYESCFRK